MGQMRLMTMDMVNVMEWRNGSKRRQYRMKRDVVRLEVPKQDPGHKFLESRDVKTCENWIGEIMTMTV